MAKQKRERDLVFIRRDGVSRKVHRVTWDAWPEDKYGYEEVTESGDAPELPTAVKKNIEKTAEKGTDKNAKKGKEKQPPASPAEPPAAPVTPVDNPNQD